MVDTHVSEVENEIFPKLREALTENDLSNMEEILNTAKIIPTQSFPGATSIPPANLFAGPLTGAWDRIKELVIGRKGQ
jgi:hemerythrin superfamily protein